MEQVAGDTDVREKRMTDYWDCSVTNSVNNAVTHGIARENEGMGVENAAAVGPL